MDYVLNKYLSIEKQKNICHVHLPFYNKSFSLDAGFFRQLSNLAWPLSDAALILSLGEEIAGTLKRNYLIISIDEDFLHNGFLQKPSVEAGRYFSLEDAAQIPEGAFCFISIQSGFEIKKDFSTLNGAAYIREELFRIFKGHHTPEGGAMLHDENLNKVVRLSDLPLYDTGNLVFLAGVDTFESFRQKITKIVRALLKQSLKAIFIGGDHTSSFFILKAMAEKHKQINVIHFDAHTDAYDQIHNPLIINHANVFNHISRLKEVKNIYQIGVRKDKVMYASDEKGKDKFIRLSSYDICSRRTEPEAFFKGANKKLPVYLSFDIDVMDPAYAPEVTHPEAGGLNYYEILHFLEYIKANFSIIGYDFVEVCGTDKKANQAAKNVAKFIKALVC